MNKIAFTDSTRDEYMNLESILICEIPGLIPEAEEIIKNEFPDMKYLILKIKRIIEINEQIIKYYDYQYNDEESLFDKYHRMQKITKMMNNYGLYILNRGNIIESIYYELENFILDEKIEPLSSRSYEIKNFKNDLQEFLYSLDMFY